jgi:hypothetical protein
MPTLFKLPTQTFVVQNAPETIYSHNSAFSAHQHQTLRKILVTVFQYLTVTSMLKECPIR